MSSRLISIRMGTTSILDEWRKISYDIRPFLLNHAINGNVLGYTEVIERQGFRWQLFDPYFMNDVLLTVPSEYRGTVFLQTCIDSSLWIVFLWPIVTKNKIIVHRKYNIIHGGVLT